MYSRDIPKELKVKFEFEKPFEVVKTPILEWNRAALKKERAQGKDRITVYHNCKTGAQGFSLDDPKVWPVFKVAASLGLVVQCHCGYDIGYSGRYDACGPKEIAVFLKNVPGIKFIAAHLGGCSGFAPHSTDEIIDLGCWADTSALTQNWSRDEEMRLCQSWPTERLLFGTDFPWVSYQESLRWLKSMRNEKDLPRILGENARELLRI